MNDALLMLVLVPPALYGIARAAEDWRRRRALRQAQQRHPSADQFPVCDLCHGQVFDERVHWMWCPGWTYDGETR